jgi:hypothetical protein
MIGQAEAFSLAARLGGMAWRRPMTYQFTAVLVQALGGPVRQVGIDRVVEEAYAATVAVQGPQGERSVDARPSDALNLAVLVDPARHPRLSPRGRRVEDRPPPRRLPPIDQRLPADTSTQ